MFTNSAVLMAVLIVSGTTLLSAENSEFSDCYTCDTAVSNIRDALRVEDYERIGHIVNCMWGGPVGIDECAEKLFMVTSEEQDACSTLAVDYYLIIVPRIAYSKYGCKVFGNACDIFLNTEECAHIDSPSVRDYSQSTLQRLFSMIKRSGRAITAYRFISGDNAKNVSDDAFFELREYSKELTESEVYHICTLFEKDPRFVSNVACEPIRKRFSELKKQNYCPQSREDVLGLIREEIRAVVAQFSDKYGDKDVEPFKGLPQSEVTFGL